MKISRLTTFFCCLSICLSAAERPPNVVFILADDLGYMEGENTSSPLPNAMETSSAIK